MRWAAAFVVAALAACAPADAPGYLEEQWRLCQQSVIPGQRLGACSAVVRSTATPPDRRAQALIQRGIQRSQQGQHVRAIADFGRALRINPNLVDAYLERGAAHQSRGAYIEALGDFDAALSLDPRSGRAAQLREAAQQLAENTESTELNQLMQLIAQDPTNPSLWNNRCWLRAVNGEALEHALADCNEALRLAPGDANILDSRGLVHLKREDNAAAFADYDAAVVREPDRGHFLFGRGIAQLRLGRKNEGNADIAAAERYEPGVAAAYASYGITP